MYGEDVVADIAEGISHHLKNLRLNIFKGMVYLNTTLTELFQFNEIKKIENVSQEILDTSKIRQKFG